jgi:hypothetical protein
MAQIKNKFLEGASGATTSGVTDDKIRLRSANYLRSRNAANGADVNVLRVNGSDVIEFASVPQIASGTPSSANDIARIVDVQNIAAGLRSVKDACKVVFTANTALSALGTSLVVDGVTLVNADRVLLSAQTTTSQNGIYTVSGVGSAIALTRAVDADGLTTGTSEINYGMSTLIIEGTANVGSTWMVTTANPITIGSTALTISKITQGTTYTGGDMTTVTGSVVAIDLLAAGGLSSSNPGNAAGQLQINVAAATVKINGSNQIEGTKPVIDAFTLIAGDITNQYVDLSQVAENAASIRLTVVGGPEQKQATDYTVNLTGGVGSKTRITFAGDLATAGAAQLVATDVLTVEYRYL